MLSLGDANSDLCKSVSQAGINYTKLKCLQSGMFGIIQLTIILSCPEARYSLIQCARASCHEPGRLEPRFASRFMDHHEGVRAPNKSEGTRLPGGGVDTRVLSCVYKVALAPLAPLTPPHQPGRSLPSPSPITIRQLLDTGGSYCSGHVFICGFKGVTYSV